MADRAAARIEVACREAAEGWTCAVTVDDGAGRTSHTVGVAARTLAELDPGAASPAPLVRAAFEYLLEREAKESILRAFALPEIGRYFPGFELEIARRVRAGGPP